MFSFHSHQRFDVLLVLLGQQYMQCIGKEVVGLEHGDVWCSGGWYDGGRRDGGPNCSSRQKVYHGTRGRRTVPGSPVQTVPVQDGGPSSNFPLLQSPR